MSSASASRDQGLGRRLCIGLAGSLLLALVAATARAEDVNAPPWRGLPLTTVAQWEFLQSPTGGPPTGGAPDGLIPTVIGDGGGAPNYTAGGDITWNPVFNGSWIGGAQGGALEFYIPNWIDREPWKWLQVQITYQPNPLVGPPSVTNLNAFDSGGPITAINQISAIDLLINPQNNLWQRIELWQIFPNPDWEQFTIPIFPDVAVTEVVVDSWSVPEPGTISLAGCGAILLGLSAWRRRRR